MKTTTKLWFAATLLSTSALGAAQGTNPSLYDRLGGIHKIAAAADHCITTEFSDPIIMGNKNVQMALKSSPMPLIKFGLAAYLAQLSGGPQKMLLDIPSYEKTLMLTKKERDRAWDIRWKGFERVGVAKKDFLQLKAMYEAKYKSAKPMKPMMENLSDKGVLYNRIGGIGAISLVVNDFVDMLATDPVQLGNANVVKSLTSGKVTGPGLKYLLCEQLGMATGGPFKYTGRSMAESHKGLRITEKEWQSAAMLLKKVLDKYQVPASDQELIFAAVSKTHADIVDK